MQNKSKKFLINTLLILVVFFLLWIGYVGFVGGPAQVYKEEDRLFMDAIAEYKDLDSARLLNRFALDKVYYVVEVEKDGAFNYAWFDKDFKEYKTYDVIDIEKAYLVADDMGIAHDAISYGVFNDELVFVLKDKSYNEYYLDINTLELLTLNGGA